MTVQFVRRFIDPRHEFRRWIDPRIQTLRTADLIAYLRSRGWKALPPDRNGLLAFQEPTGATAEGRPFCQFVPLYEDYNDYPRMVFELLTGLAEFEDRQASEVIDDILRLTHGSETNGASEAGPSATATGK